MTGVFIKEEFRHTDRDRHRENGYVMMETGVMHMQAKEFQRFLGVTKSWEAKQYLPLETSEKHGPADTLISDP